MNLVTWIYLNQGAGAHFDIVIKKKKKPKADNQIMQLKPRESKGEKYLGRVTNAESARDTGAAHLCHLPKCILSCLCLSLIVICFKLDLGYSILSFNWAPAKGAGDLSAQGSSL